MKQTYTFEEFVKIVEKLRAPDGCPWDSAQTHESLKSCIVNETAEALAAVDVLRETQDGSNLCEELGDLLMLIVLQSRIAEQEGLFGIADVVNGAAEKMIRRHPHVFAGRKEPQDWEEIKRLEKQGVPEHIEQAKKKALEKARADMAALCMFCSQALEKP